jgi:hypothetical protein
MNEIERYEDIERAWNGKPVRSSDEQIILILRPMFASFPQAKVNEDMSDMYVKMLRDIDPMSLANAVLHAMEFAEFLPTIGAIRKAYEETKRTPAAASRTPQAQMEKRIPGTMFRLDPEEDRRQRMERLRQTKNWNY